MQFSLRKLVRGLDRFGHQIKVNYKGEETYNSSLGGIITVAVYALTLILIVKSAEEILLMQDPKITAFSKPLNLEERAELVPVAHDDYDFVFGFYVSLGIPPEIGTWIVANTNSKELYSASSLLDCRDVIDEEIVAGSSPEIVQAYAAGSSMCIDPQDAQWGKFKDEIGDDGDALSTSLYFLPCTNEGKEGKQIDCYSQA